MENLEDREIDVGAGVIYEIYKLNNPSHKHVVLMDSDKQAISYARSYCGMYGGVLFCPRSQKDIGSQFRTGVYWTGNKFLLQLNFNYLYYVYMTYYYFLIPVKYILSLKFIYYN